MDLKSYLLEFYISQNGERVSKELAEKLVHDLAVTDGSDRTDGQKWTIDESKNLGDKLGVNWDAVSLAEWYLVLNSMYSDYYSVGRKHGLTDPMFYGELALAWFNDVDGCENKTFNYFFDC